MSALFFASSEKCFLSDLGLDFPGNQKLNFFDGDVGVTGETGGIIIILIINSIKITIPKSPAIRCRCRLNPKN